MLIPGDNSNHGPLIKEVIITPVAIVDPPLLNAAGLHAPYALRTIVEIVTNDNISGISEIPGNAAIDAALAAAGQLIIGKDPFRLNQIRNILENNFGSEPMSERGLTPWDQRKMVHIFSSIEVACLDIIGKVIGRPVVDLLGGKLAFKTDEQATGWAKARQASAVTPEEIVVQAKAMCMEFGFRSIKLKAGVFEPHFEVDTMFALSREFGPGVPLRIDPNGVWEVNTAIEYGRKLKPIIEYLEDPVRGQANMALVREALQIPLATNMCTTSFNDIPNSIRLHSEDIILSDHHFWGGLRASMELAAICATFGRDLSMHSNSHLGISLAAMVHLGAALPNLRYALDTHYPWQSDEVIAGGRLKFEEGRVKVPEGPGLGVELDRDALALLHQNYLDCGLTKREDEIEMRKIEPGWKFKAVRW